MNTENYHRHEGYQQGFSDEKRTSGIMSKPKKIRVRPDNTVVRIVASRKKPKRSHLKTINMLLELNVGAKKLLWSFLSTVTGFAKKQI